MTSCSQTYHSFASCLVKSMAKLLLVKHLLNLVPQSGQIKCKLFITCNFTIAAGMSYAPGRKNASQIVMSANSIYLLDQVVIGIAIYIWTELYLDNAGTAFFGRGLQVYGSKQLSISMSLSKVL